MLKSYFIYAVLFLLTSFKGQSQSLTLSPVPNYVYHPASEDKPSWQRLNLMTANQFYRGMKLSRISHDSSLLHVSRVLGISRLIVTAEGIDDPELINQSKWFDERNPGKGRQLLSQAEGEKKFELMILLGAYYSFQPGSYKLYRDSVEYFLKTATAERKTSNEKRLGRVALCLLGRMYGIGSDTTNLNSVFNQLINECLEAGDRKTEARAFYYRGVFTPYTGSNLPEKIGWLQKAREIYHELKDTESEINMFTNVAFLYMFQNKFDEAQNAFVKALELEKSIGYPYTHYSLDHIAMVSMLRDKFGEPLKYTLESIKVAETVRDSIGLAEFYLRLGQLYYIEGGKSEESLKWMSKALDRLVILNDGNVYSTLYNVAGLMIEETGQKKEAQELVLNISKKAPPTNADDQIHLNLSFALCYTSNKQYDRAERYITAADSIQKLFPAIGFAGVYQKKAISDIMNTVNFEQGKYSLVKKYLEAALSDNSGMSVLSDPIHSYQRLIFIDSVFGDAVSGVKHYKLYTELLDSNFRASSIRQAEELQVIYQTKEKEDQIASLHQQTKLELANLKQATLVRNLTIAGILAVLIIAGLLYRQNRLKQRSNSEITRKNELLQQMLTEKEWLLKEIHHRVKNNLQIVMSLLNSQSAYIDNESALTAIHDSQHRVHAMSLIHQKLYNSENLSTIDVSFYIRELVSYLSDSFNTGQRIHFDLTIETLEMDVSQAVPLGLILNEAITNSIKYAFPDGRNGIITISLLCTAPHHYLLSISDNGIGIPVNYNNKKSGSLGMSLIAGLSEDLEGKFSIENNNGTMIKISFVYDAGVKGIDISTASFVKNT